MQTPKTPSTQPNTEYSSRADYERQRDARESALMKQAFTRLVAEQVARTAEPSPVESFAQVRTHTITGGLELDSVQGSEPMTIRVDYELARVAVGEKLANPLRVWMVLEETARTTGRNYVLKGDLAALLQSYGITCSAHNLRIWLKNGNGLFWIITTYGICLIGYKKVATKLTQYARENGLPDLVSTNRPGQGNPVYIAVSGSLQTFEANVYAAWLSAHNNPTISRFTLELLWNRYARVLREWEQAAGILVISGDKHFTSDHTDAIPTDAEGNLRGDVFQYDVKGQTRWKAQASNTYHAPAVKQHSNRGQSRAVAREVLELLESDNPAGNCKQVQGGTAALNGGLQPLGKLYFSDYKHAKQSAKRTGDQPRLVPIGRDKFGAIQWSYSPDGRQRIALVECPLAYHFGSNYV
ncbi:MAG: hypothetical protein H0X30_25355 [Anaerolineae bacterium]|nr:hypothetical protein [Anaerolineae bacterium]